MDFFLPFFPHVRDHAEQLQQREGESNRDFQMRVEEDWVAQQGRGSEWDFNTRRRESLGDDIEEGSRSLSNAHVFGPGLGDMDVAAPGSMRDFVWGFFMGFFLGVIMLFWLWERSVSQRQKMGIIFGVSLQLSLNFVHQRPSDRLGRTA